MSLMSVLIGSGQGRRALAYTFSASTANASLNVSTLAGYIAGYCDITITINSGVYLYSTSVANSGLTLTGGATGDTITIVNNGYIMGQGGNGVFGATAGNAGGPALSIAYPVTINNTNPAAYIGGGGGGGRGTPGSGGGGGAGGGSGSPTPTQGAGGGGAIGASGGNGTTTNGGAFGGGAGGGGGGYIQTPKGVTANGGGGGGGRIFPGVGGAGGSGSVGQTPYKGGAGGSANAAGGPTASSSSGGGGGWGASGGSTPQGSGGSGGRAVTLNGKTVTWVSGDTTRVYGAVS